MKVQHPEPKNEVLTLEEQVIEKQFQAEYYAHALRLHLAVNDWPSVRTGEEEQEKSENFEKCLNAIKELYFDCYWWRVFEGVGLKPLGALSVLPKIWCIVPMRKFLSET